MKIRIVSVIFVIALCASLMTSAFASSSPQVLRSPQSVLVDGATKSFEVYNIDGNNYFKLRDIAYVLSGTIPKFSVSYDSEKNLISVVSGEAYTAIGGEMNVGADKSGTAVLSTQSILINGEVSQITAYNIGGNNFFQLRELADLLDFSVSYSAASNTVLIYSGSAEKPILSAEEIYEKCAPAVFFVEAIGPYSKTIRTGSGFFIDDKGTAVTNFHVLNGCMRAEITVSDTGKVYDIIGVYDYNREEDWAIIKVEGSGFSYLDIGEAETVAGGATIYAIGSPLGLQNSISQGIVSNPKRIESEISYIQVSAAISAGSSGGALINEYGEAIGITSASYVDGQNLNLALPVSYISAGASKYTAPGAKSATTFNSIPVTDPIEFLEEYLLGNGTKTRVLGEDVYGIFHTSGMQTDTCGIYYIPQTDTLYLESTYKISDLRRYVLDIYIKGGLTTEEGAKEYNYSYIFKYFDEEKDDDAEYFAYGSISAPEFTEEDYLTFEKVVGDDDKTTAYEAVAQRMAGYCTEEAYSILSNMVRPVTLEDLGFKALYKYYLSWDTTNPY